MPKEQKYKYLQTYSKICTSHTNLLMPCYTVTIVNGYIVTVILVVILNISNNLFALQKREKGKMRIHHVQNIQRALTYLEKDCKIKLINITSEEIEQGDAKLTLGLVWTLILYFQVGYLFISVKIESVINLVHNN